MRPAMATSFHIFLIDDDDDDDDDDDNDGPKEIAHQPFPHQKREKGKTVVQPKAGSLNMSMVSKYRGLTI